MGGCDRRNPGRTRDVSTSRSPHQRRFSGWHPAGWVLGRPGSWLGGAAWDSPGAALSLAPRCRGLCPGGAGLAGGPGRSAHPAPRGFGQKRCGLLVVHSLRAASQVCVPSIASQHLGTGRSSLLLSNWGFLSVATPRVCSYLSPFSLLWRLQPRVERNLCLAFLFPLRGVRPWGEKRKIKFSYY